MNSIKQQDLQFGKQSEEEVFPILQNKFDIELKKSDYKFATFDFYSDKYFIELKSRHNNHDKYDTTMIGYNKIKKCIDKNKTYIFCFKFTDGLFYWQYDKIEFERLCSVKMGGRKDRSCVEYSQYVYIPVSLLKKIE